MRAGGKNKQDPRNKHCIILPMFCSMVDEGIEKRES